MLNARNKRKFRNASNKLKQFVTRNWFILALILGIAMVFPYIKRYFATQTVKNQENILNNQVQLSSSQNAKVSPTIIKAKSNKMLAKYPNLKKADLNRLETYAQAIAKALGTDAWGEHPLFGVSFLPLVFDKYTEDEEKVISILKKTPGTFPIVADLYYNVFTRSRNLKSDLYELLNESELNQIRHTYKKYGKHWI